MYNVRKLFIIAAILTLPAASAAESKATLRALENKLFPYFTYQSQSRKSSQNSIEPQPPTPTELMKITRNWSLLSDGFKKVYLQTTSIPADFLMFRSPGYGMELYYTNSGTNAPDLTDTWHADSSDWHKRVAAPNGIPDYIDEVAWAIDSAWNMEIGRFGFPAPFPYNYGIHTSEHYKVVVKSLGSTIYGVTYPFAPDSTTGFRSLLCIRNTWKGWNINNIIDYETHPEKGIRITCAHEFFHAIQYRMSHNVDNDIYLDDFPVSWVEGTAVMMEELGFPEVNDFTQYSGSYLKTPSRFTVFGRLFNESIYSNALVCLFIYKHCAQAPNQIDFFRTIFTGNQTGATPFDTLLAAGIAPYSMRWTDLLNSFHTASFFTNTNSSENVFIDDAPLLPSLTYTPGDGNGGKTVLKTVLPRSVQFTSYLRTADDENVLNVTLAASADKRTADYAVRYILRSNTTSPRDTVVQFDKSYSDSVTVSVPAWKRWDEIIVVVTNGMAVDTLETGLRFSTHPGPVTYTPHLLQVTTNVAADRTVRYLLNGRAISSSQFTGHHSFSQTPDQIVGQGIVVKKGLGKPRLIMRLR